jgi:hypothetical protein
MSRDVVHGLLRSDRTDTHPRWPLRVSQREQKISDISSKAMDFLLHLNVHQDEWAEGSN